MQNILQTVALFSVSAVCELGGAYLIWQWQRAGQPTLCALLGIAGLFIYSLTQTMQTFGFGRAFAAYAACLS